MARLVRSWATRWTIPWPVLAVLVGLTAVAWVQGLRLAADRSARLQPVRIEVVVPDATGTATVARAARFANLDLGPFPPERVGLFQILPARPLVRWIEDAGRAPSHRWLVVPLDGLPAGLYAVCSVDPDATAGPVEMDRPLEELVEVGRFRVID